MRVDTKGFGRAMALLRKAEAEVGGGAARPSLEVRKELGKLVPTLSAAHQSLVNTTMFQIGARDPARFKALGMPQPPSKQEFLGAAHVGRGFELGDGGGGALAKRLEQLSPNPSADELLQVLASSRGEKKASLAPLAKAAEGALERTFGKAAKMSSPDILAVYAEDAGKLQELIRATGNLPPSMEAKVGALMNRIVDLRESELRGLGAGLSRGQAADAIRESESMGESLKSDVARLQRFGFPAPKVDIDALVFAVKSAAVAAFTR